MADSTNQHPKGPSARQVLTASAAASLMLTAPTGLASVAVNSAIAPVSIVAPSVSADRRTVRRRFLMALSAARVQHRDATAAAYRTFRSAISVHVCQRAKSVAQSATKSARRAAARVYGEAILPAKTSRDAALADAHEAYVGAVEAARVEFVDACGAEPTTIASVRHEQAVHIAAATYRGDVQRARRKMRVDECDARSVFRSALDLAATDPQRASARRVFENSKTDASDVFRVRVGAARTTFTTHINLAKTAFKASMSMATAVV
ncbi:MAG: hypothetical protein HQ526_01330 [Actinobacteria bacterium]|nr:hypothetical protein [Actinomycetota bacterium]